MMVQHDESRPGGAQAEEKSAGQELAEGLGSLFRAAKRVVAEVDQARIEALGKKAFQELDRTRLGALGRKAIEKVERFDPADLGRVSDLFGKAVQSVESFVRHPGHQASGEATSPVSSAEPQATAASSADEKEERVGANGASEGTGASWRFRVDE